VVWGIFENAVIAIGSATALGGVVGATRTVLFIFKNNF
jgi:hypothetical protein